MKINILFKRNNKEKSRKEEETTQRTAHIEKKKETYQVEWSFTPVFPFDLRGHSRRPQVEWEVEWEVERDDTFKVEWEYIYYGMR